MNIPYELLASREKAMQQAMKDESLAERNASENRLKEKVVMPQVTAYIADLTAAIDNDPALRAYIRSAGGWIVLRHPDFSNSMDSEWLLLSCQGTLQYWDNPTRRNGAFVKDYVCTSDPTIQKYILSMVLYNQLTPEVIDTTTTEWIGLVADIVGDRNLPMFDFRRLYYAKAAEVNLAYNYLDPRSEHETNGDHPRNIVLRSPDDPVD